MSAAAGGRPQRVVLVHGVRDDSRSFEPVVAELPELDVVLYDRRGWAPGSSELPTDLATHVEDLLAVLDGRPAVVVGHSWGGNVALAVASEHPELVRSVGVYETAMTWLPGWPHGHRALIDSSIEKVMARPASSEAQAHGRELFAIEGRLNAVPTFDVTRPLPPCVVSWGTASPDHFQLGMRLVAETLGASSVVLEGQAHMAHREDPAAFARLVRAVVAAAPVEGADASS